MCTFDFQLGQGRTHTWRQSRALKKIFTQNLHKLKDISHIFTRPASAIKVVEIDRDVQTTSHKRNRNFTAAGANQIESPL